MRVTVTAMRAVTRQAPELVLSVMKRETTTRLTLALLAALVALVLAFPSAPARAATTLTVANTNDSGADSLRQAILDATAGDTIDFSVTGTITLTSGQLSINKDLTISGPGAGSLTIDGNASTVIFNIPPSGASVSISGLTITNGNNSGIRNYDGTLTLTDSTVSGNLENCGGGGGIYNNSGTLTLTNSTVSGNSSSCAGGGIYNSDTVNFKNTIIAGNSTGGSAPDCLGTVTSQGYNLVQDTSGCTITGDTTGNITGQDPLLDPLALNSPGTTETRALGTGSPAIDAGNPAAPGSGGNACEATDQRGVARPGGAACDIGAYEVEVAVSQTFYRDADSDTFGDPNDSQQAIGAPAGFVLDNTDCNDGVAAINPDATEVLDGIDNDCDGQVDEGTETFYRDADSDTFGDPNDSQQAIGAPAGFVLDNTDCNDAVAAINPDATEVLDGIDNDCDGQVDEGAETFYRDADSDTFGDPNDSQQAIGAPAGFVLDNTDCNDAVAAINPDATEVLDGIDNDCDGQVDEGFGAEAAIAAVAELRATLGNLPDSDFKDADSKNKNQVTNNRRWFDNRLDAILDNLDAGMFDAALDNANNMLRKVDWCENQGTLDSNDKIRTCGGQAVIAPLVIDLIALLQ